MRVCIAWLALMVLFAGSVIRAAEQSRLLAQQPTVSKKSIVFTYGGYLWSVARPGGEARQLTTGGHERSPLFSPDGQWIAFTGE